MKGKEFEIINIDDKNIIKPFIDYFISKRQVQQLAQ
jgi:hypothetical protein